MGLYEPGTRSWTQDEPSDEKLRQICLDRFCSECPELATKQDELLRVVADADNFKKRLIREKEEFLQVRSRGGVSRPASLCSTIWTWPWPTGARILHAGISSRGWR
jgi:hypothetical protein